jgi:hypothetical protein
MLPLVLAVLAAFGLGVLAGSNRGRRRPPAR